jgi:hypothetical protein
MANLPLVRPLSIDRGQCAVRWDSAVFCRMRNSVSGRWVRARYVAERQEIAALYREWGPRGPAEAQTGAGEVFSPWRGAQTRRRAAGVEPLTLDELSDLVALLTSTATVH